MQYLHEYVGEFIGEFIGTGILVFFGCASVAVTVLFSAHSGLLQIAFIWGIAVTLAIYATRHLSCAHLNPAVSVAMVLGERMNVRRLPIYLIAQFLGAFLAACLLYLLFSPSIELYEHTHDIIRGSSASIQTAMMFGEFYPNPGAGNNVSVPMLTAFLAEAVGTFTLVFLIFSLTEGCNTGRPDDALAPVFIGLTVTLIIAVIAPLTQAGLNPARDMSPRLFAWLAGWDDAALPDNYAGLIVYLVAPIVGAALAAIIFTNIIEPIMNKRTNDKMIDNNNCCH